MRRSRAERLDAEIGPEPAASSSGSWRISLSSRAERPIAAVPAAEAQSANGARTSASRRISSSSRLTTAMSGLWVRKRKPRRSVPRRRSRSAPERRLGFEEAWHFSRAASSRTSRSLFLAATCFQLLDPALDDGQVAQEELGFYGGQVAARVDRFERMRHGRIAERPDDGQEGVGRPQLAQELLAEGGLFRVPGGDALELDELDGRGRLLLGLEDRGQLLEAGIGHLDHGDGIGPLGRRRLGGRARQGGKERAFP